MNTELTKYVLEVTLVWGAMLVFYLLALCNNRAWPMQRRYLLAAWILGLLLPALPDFTTGPATTERLSIEVTRYIVPPIESTIDPSTGFVHFAFRWVDHLLAFWLTGTLVSVGIAVTRIALHLRPRPLRTYDFRGYTVVESAEVQAPYTLLGRIYLPTGLDSQLHRTALLHEAAHLDHGHTKEQLFLLLGCCICWFHPLTWVYARLLSNVHEYEADAAVVQSVPVKLYGTQLVCATLAPRPLMGLFSSPLKRRIMLLTRRDIPRRLTSGHWMLLCLLLVDLVLACGDKTDLDGEFLQQRMNARITSYPPRLDQDHRMETAWHELMDTIYQEIRYPTEARQQGLYGTVRAQVFFDERGKLISSTVPASPPEIDETFNDFTVNIISYTDTKERQYTQNEAADNALVAEARRITNYLSNLQFEPATEDGVSVPGSIYIYYSFKFED